MHPHVVFRLLFALIGLDWAPDSDSVDQVQIEVTNHALESLKTWRGPGDDSVHDAASAAVTYSRQRDTRSFGGLGWAEEFSGRLVTQRGEEGCTIDYWFPIEPAPSGSNPGFWAGRGEILVLGKTGAEILKIGIGDVDSVPVLALLLADATAPFDEEREILERLGAWLDAHPGTYCVLNGVTVSAFDFMAATTDFFREAVSE